MKNYKIIKIIDNNNLNFYLDVTSMKDFRIRMSILRGQFRDYLSGLRPYKPVYDILSGDFSACVVARNLTSIEEVKQKKDALNIFYLNKYKNETGASEEE